MVYYSYSIRKEEMNMDRLLDNAQDLKDLLDNGARLGDGGEVQDLMQAIAQQAMDLLEE